MQITPLVRLFLVTILGLAGAIGGLGCAAAQEATPPASPAAADTVDVTGEVARPGALTLADLQALPAETVDVSFRLSDGTPVQHTYTGARLWDALQLVQPAIDPALPESSLRLYLVVTAKDGYVVVLSMGEIDPEFGAQPYLLAWEEDGQALTGERSPVTLVVPGDTSEGRYIYGIVSIEVRSIDTASGS